MTPEDLHTLQAQLQQLLADGQQANPEGDRLQNGFLTAQQHFQTQVLPHLGHPDLLPSGAPILTEMNRTFRLLAMDVAFLQAARQPATAQQRQRQLSQNIQQLLGFCEALGQALG
ncbi:MAG: heterocyst frequency control protein PatD [Nodosilinea sp.]